MKLSRKANRLSSSSLAAFFEKAAATPGAISLAVGEFNEPTAPHITKRIARAMEEEEANLKRGFAGEIKYTPVSGLSELRRLIAEKHNCSVENVAVGAGSKLLLSQAVRLLVNPEASVMVLSPHYPYYEGMATQNENQLLALDISKTGFKINIHELLPGPATINANLRNLLILNSPNNPTGIVFSGESLKQLASLAKTYNMYVLSDESYAAITYGAITYDNGKHTNFASLPEMAERTVSIYSFSKEYNMTGWRVGYAIGPENFIAKLKIALEKFEGCASYVSQLAAIAALRGPQDIIQKMVEELKRRRCLLMEWLDEKGISYAPPDGAFYVFANLPERTEMKSERFAEFLLEKAGVVVTPGTAFGNFDKYVRISYAPISLRKLEIAIKRMNAAFTALRR